MKKVRLTDTPFRIFSSFLGVVTGPLRPRRHLATDYILRWKGVELTPISKNSRCCDRPPDRASGSDKTKVNGDLCPPLSLPPGNDYSQSYRQEGPLAGEVLKIALTAKTLPIAV